MTDRPYLILDCYFDERGAAPNIRALLQGDDSQTVRAVQETLPTDFEPFAGVVITGSKACLSSPEPWMDGLLDRICQLREIRKPLLGLCFGHQAIAAALYDSEGVRLAPRGELGWEQIRVLESNQIIEGLPAAFTCFVSHFDEVTPGLPGMDVFATSENCEVQGFQIQDEPIWGLQFHPEMDPQESEALVRRNLERHETQGEDPEEVLASRCDGRHLGVQVFANFRRFCTGFEE